MAKSKECCYTSSVDLWAVGCILYYIYIFRFSLLTNKSPFKGSNDRETIARIKELDYILPDNGNLVSNEACDLIRHLLTVV